jgi:hypothetical protein
MWSTETLWFDLAIVFGDKYYDLLKVPEDRRAFGLKR